MHRKRTQGFTLIELLIVIAIIAVLAAIMIPNFNASRKRPYDVAALQCGKAIVAAQITYIAEHNETAANNAPGMNNSDVTEQCAKVQIADAAPTTGMSGDGNNLINVGGSNYSFFVWSHDGTSVYLYNRDVPDSHFRKVN